MSPRRHVPVRAGLIALGANALGQALLPLACSAEPQTQAGEDASDASDVAVSPPEEDSGAPPDAETDEDVRVPRFADGDCSSDSWCMVPLPLASRAVDNPYILYGLWASATDDVWAVGGARSRLNQGELAIVLHYDGANWSIVYERAGRTAAPYSSRFTGIFASSTDDLWVWGSGPPLHILRDAQSGALTFDTNDVPRADDGKLVLGLAVGGRAPDGIWAVGSDVFHRVTDSGGKHVWQRVELGLEPNFTWERIAAVPGDDRLVMIGFRRGYGGGGRLVRSTEDGGFVTHSFDGPWWWGDPIPSSLWVAGYDDIWHSRQDLRHSSIDGGIFTFDTVDAGGPFAMHAVTGTPDHRLWTAGVGGQVFHFDGTAFERSSTQVGGVVVGRTIYALFALTDKDVWAAGDNVLMHRRAP